ncbi:MAG: hypothetical protein DWI03_08335 [Planctomycetota bacterium]|nr:MAG: hypothetical protein DWI03_08335 [Planctomycetota bacterium]
MSNASQPSGGVVHEIRWSDALPWWIIFRAAAAAFSPTVIVLGALGAAATWAGWSAGNQLGLAGGISGTGGAVAAVQVDEGAVLLLPDAGGDVFGGAVLAPSRDAVPWLEGLSARLPEPLIGASQLLAVPFSPTATLQEMGGALARIGWFVLVWSIFGTAISRHVALRLAGEEAPGILGATLYGSRKWLPSFNSVLFVLVGIMAMSVPGALLGLLMRTEWGLAFAGAVWPLVLLGAVVLAILAVGVVAGWPLMVAAVGVERGDSFQAISTSFSYIYQRPLHYAFYGLVALLIAVPALVVAGVFADATGTLAMWAASLGMGPERTRAVLEGLAGQGPTAGSWGVKALVFWTRGLAALLSSFGWGYFWAIATAVYLLLRQDVDGTEMDEVVIDEPGGAQ